MEKYNPKSVCPKCSHEHPSVQYVKSVMGEHMKRTCNHCGYSWKEKPNDAK